MFLQIRVQADFGAPVGMDTGSLAYNEPGHARHRGLAVLGIDAVVADERIRHRHDLTGVRGIREDLLIPRHRRVEDDLAEGGTGSTQNNTVEAAAVFQYEVGRAVQERFLRRGSKPDATGKSYRRRGWGQPAVAACS